MNLPGASSATSRSDSRRVRRAWIQHGILVTALQNRISSELVGSGMMTILIDHLSQPYTRGILHEQRKAQHLVQLDQHLLTRISPHEDTLIFSHTDAKRANVLSAQPPLHQHHRMLCFFHMTTGGIDASLPRTWPSRFGSSDHVLVCLPNARPNGAHSSVCLSAFEHPHGIAYLRLGSLASSG